jgi:O-antigen ligase
MAAMLAGICSLIVCSDRERARQLLKVVAWSGALYALYGIGSFAILPTKLLWREKQAYLDSLTGTFVNRNTAAVYFGACAIVWFVFLCERIRRRSSKGELNWKELFYRLSTKVPGDVISAFAFLFICLAAMFMTRSRAGVVLSLAALVAAFALFFRRDLPRRRSVVAAVAIAGALGLVLLQIMGGGVTGRLDVQGLADQGRLETYRSSISLIMDNPWFGTGLGTFPAAYPAYRSANISMSGVWDRAHNTLLELAAELGLPMAGLLVLVWIIALAVLIRGSVIRRRDLIFPVIGVSVGMLSVIHSLVDFSLQITGFAIVVFALVGAGLAQSFRPPDPARDSRNSAAASRAPNVPQRVDSN